jgi:hypothetical protein
MSKTNTTYNNATTQMLPWIYRPQMSKTHTIYNYTAAQMLPRI